MVNRTFLVTLCPALTHMCAKSTQILYVFTPCVGHKTFNISPYT